MKTQNFDVFETTKAQPGEMAGKVLEQMGVTSAQVPGGQQKPVVPEQGKNIEEMKAADKARSRQQISKIEAELRGLRRMRKEQLRQRQQPSKSTPATAEVKPFQEPTLKPKRGLFGFWTRRAQRAREQAQPEMVGRRVGG